MFYENHLQNKDNGSCWSSAMFSAQWVFFRDCEPKQNFQTYSLNLTVASWSDTGEAFKRKYLNLSLRLGKLTSLREVSEVLRMALIQHSVLGSPHTWSCIGQCRSWAYSYSQQLSEARTLVPTPSCPTWDSLKGQPLLKDPPYQPDPNFIRTEWSSHPT